MTYYDELGISPHAAIEEVREAYRQLARLLHPDRLQDPRQRTLAEGQMKRLNHMYQTLSSPELRRAYDHSLTSRAAVPQPVFIPEPKMAANPGWRSGRPVNFGPGWLLLAAFAGGLFAWLVSSISGERPERLPLVSRERVAQPLERTGATSIAANGGLEPLITGLRTRLNHAERDRDVALARLRLLEREPPGGSTSPAPTTASEVILPIQPVQSMPESIPMPVKTSSAPVSNTPPHSRNLSGRWYFVRPSDAASPRNMYPPEFIEAVLLEDNGMIRGRHRARYKVVDRAISPEVDFQFVGKLNQGALVSNWIGLGGAKGEVRIRQLSTDTIELAWVATDLGRHQGLGYGTAVLVRRQDP